MKKLTLVLVGCALLWACTQPKPEPEAAPAVETKKPIEIGESKYVDIGKQFSKSLADGNIDAMGELLADDAKFFWNYGDSLIGKKAIVDYWKERRGKVIDTLTFSNPIWLAVDVNEAGPDAAEPGTWVLSWNAVSATYASTGKTMTQYTHQASHFDENDKIDYIAQYLDRMSIQAALKK
jgi:hypothetical protein